MSLEADHRLRLLPARMPRILVLLFAAFLGGLLSLERLGVAAEPLRLAAVLGVLALFVAVGLLAHTIRVKGHYVGGRAVSAALGGAAAAAGGLLGATFIAVSGHFYAFSQDGLRTAAGLALAILVAFGLVGPALRRLGATSLADFLAARYGGHSMRIVAAAIVGLSAFAILVALLQAATDFASEFSGFGDSTIVAGIALLIVFACIPGGALSTTATQVAQYVVAVGTYLAALLFLAVTGAGADPRTPGAAIAAEGGADIVAAAAAAVAPLAEAFAGGSWSGEAVVILALAAGLVTSPFLLPKALSATAPRRVPVMGAYALVYALLPLVLLPLIVLAANLVGTPLAAGDVVPTWSRLRTLPAVFAGLALASVLAGILAAASAALLSASATVSHDILDRVLMTRTPESRRLFIARALIAAVAFVAFRVARAFEVDPLALIGIALALSAALLPALLLGLWWRRTNAAGAFTGLAAGLTATLWSLAANTLGAPGLGFLDFGADGLALAAAAAFGVPVTLVVTVAFSLMTDEPNPRTQDFIDEIDRRRRDLFFKERPA